MFFGVVEQADDLAVPAGGAWGLPAAASSTAAAGAFAVTPPSRYSTALATFAGL